MKASKRLDIRKCCCFLSASMDIKRQAATSHKTGNHMRQDTSPKTSAQGHIRGQRGLPAHNTMMLC